MALVRLDAPVATTPTTFVAPSVSHIANLNINNGKPSRIIGTNILAGATFNIAGVTYIADGTTAITGTQGPVVKITASGASASAAFTTTFATGFAWNEAYKAFLDTAGALYVFVAAENNFYPYFFNVTANPFGDSLTDAYNWWCTYSNTVVSTKSGTYEEAKAIGVMPYSGYVWTSFTIYTEDSYYPCYGRIYKNGVAAGTERNTLSETGATYTEKLAVTAGDELEIYIAMPIGGGNGYCCLFKILGYVGREYIEAVQ